jgi:hypothetical protein
MPSISTLASALAAIEQRLRDNWTTSPVHVDGEPAPQPEWPPTDTNGEPVAYVFVELLDVDASIIGFGSPTNQTVLDSGLCKFHVLVPNNSGLATARAHAVSIGEIFRQKEFFNSEAGVCVRTLTPRIGREASVDEGNYQSMTVTVPYEFYHRA